MPDDGAMVKLATRGKPAEVSRQLARIPGCSERQHRESYDIATLYAGAENLAAWMLQE